MSDSENKTAFLTGCSSGFGAHVAALLTARGWRVIASMRSPSRASGLLQLVSEVGGSPQSIEVLELDVARDESRSFAVEKVLKVFDGAPDLVLHSAGFTTASFFEELPQDKIREIFETNFFGAVDLTQRLLPAMRSRGSGTIGVISSNAANIAHPMYSMYAASKWALEGWAEALDVELEPFGIDVRILQPGNHATAFGSNVQVVEPKSPAYQVLQQQALVRMAKLGARARPVERGAREMCDALVGESPARLRTRIGFDDKLMAGLARWAPYDVRRRAIRRITGIKPTDA